MISKLVISIQPDQASQIADVQEMLGLPSPASAARYLVVNGLVNMQLALGQWRQCRASSTSLSQLPEIFRQALDEDAQAALGGAGPSSTRSKQSPVTGAKMNPKLKIGSKS